MIPHFPDSEHAKDLHDLNLGADPLPVKWSLRVTWDLETDTIIFTIPDMDKSFMKRGVLSIVNSIYDPFGFSAPVVVKGKMLLQQMTLPNTARAALGWDEPLPEHFKK